ncbi:MAG TPA: hypothetical protein VK501_04700 [Baekduia sp.]|uniref:hypothetical protein n=1 Tax=Baekduia sp. TaxID=2600305 RepID=UPI002D1379BE|nr:hypothetical protein [Baekduia sp.]HMJ33196.1 hypothetical protein [Baekduia sp.]
MTSLAHPDAAARFMVGRRGWAPTASERSASLTLLRARVRTLPGVELLDPPPIGRARTSAQGPLHLRIGVRGTGLTGYELGRRMRKFSGVPLDHCEADAVVAVFDDGDDISARGSRLLFALTHALTA